MYHFKITRFMKIADSWELRKQFLLLFLNWYTSLKYSLNHDKVSGGFMLASLITGPTSWTDQALNKSIIRIYPVFMSNLYQRSSLTPVIAGVWAGDASVCLLGRRRRVLALRAGGFSAAPVVLCEPLPAAPLGLVKLSEHMKPSPRNVPKQETIIHTTGSWVLYMCTNVCNTHHVSAVCTEYV